MSALWFGSRFVPAALIFLIAGTQIGKAQCANPVACENSLPGDTGWQLSGSGDSDIQGFATDISVNVGQTISFKIKTTASNYHLDIYRLGYYGGAGARKITTITPSASLPQTQPACLTDPATNLIDCGNWAVSASWTVPSTATSGYYFANVIRPDNGHESQIFWIVRNDASHSDILFQASDQTWAAYNDYGGHSLYGGPGTFDLNNRAFKVSYNRPSDTRKFEAATFLFNAEYPMIRWLEANGYDVSYFTGVDAARNGSLIKNHKVYMTAGHDEYVSKDSRTNVQAALSAGVNMAFFSGNEVFWKTRWENSIDGSNTPYRTMVCYKETYYGTGTLYQQDPLDPPTWTGTWADPRFSPPADGGLPQNALTGTLFKVNGPGPDNTDLSILVRAADGKMRFWRNTSIATLGSGQTATLPAGTLGYEWDADVDNGFRPGGLVPLSTSTYNLTTDYLQDYGATYGVGTATHHLSLYRAPSGALVFGAGTVQWAWGLDDNHDGGGNDTADSRMQQATVNLLADMGAQPATLQEGLAPATKSTDVTAPTTAITSPSAGSTVPYGSPITISGTATDTGGGVVGAVEVSVDGGKTWHPASGREQWSYKWSPWSASGTATVEVRAVDDSANLQVTPTEVSFLVGGEPTCSCSIWNNSPTPSNTSEPDSNSVELGVKFRSDVAGFVTGVRFYKGANNTGTHVGHLWTLQGSQLASVTFTNETASGWQQANFSSPVAISANTTYIVSYYAPNGGYADDEPYFSSAGVDSPPLHALANGIDGGNGVFVYASGGGFPINTFSAGNYWVDLVFVPSSPWTISGKISGVTGATVTLSGAGNATTTEDSSGNYSFSNVLNGTYTVTPSKNGFAFSPANQSVTVNGASVSGINFTANSVPTFSISGTISGTGGETVVLSGAASATVTADSSGNYSFTGLPNGNYTVTPSKSGFSFNPSSAPATINDANVAGVNFVAVQALSIWNNSTIPGTPSEADANAVELGVKFRSDVPGTVTGIRFYKGAGNTGTHIGNLWTSSGTKLATVTFTNETATGWQEVSFSSPVSIVANTTYIASYYAPNGNYAADVNFFSSSGVDNPPLHALANGVDGSNGVYLYAVGGGFPTNSFDSTNYWVDVAFVPAATFSISGTISGTGGEAVTLSGTASASVTADASGNYAFTGLANGNYTVTPSKSGFTFSPANAAVTINGVNVSGVNFTASAVNTGFSISGTISGTGGETVALSGTASATATADASGNYTFTGLANGNYTVTPSKAGFTFTPANAPVTITGADVSGVDFTAAAAATFSISGTISGTGGETVTLSGAASASVTADASGKYSFTGLVNGNYTVTPSKSGFSFNPSSAPVTINNANVAGVNFVAAQAFSIWNASAIPGTPSEADPNSVELGVKFRSDVAGTVTGVRFYKGSGNTGTHIGNLWTSSGTKLATVTFTNETATGWQQASFASPVSITANTTYIVSYYAPNGDYAADVNFFSSAGVDNPPLHALANGVDGSNGIYLYAVGGGFPTNTFNSTNYWVDVVFVPAATFSISGTISGTGGETVTLSGGASATVTADASGNYSFTGLANGNYTVTPSKSGFTFSPANRAVTVNDANVSGVNFTATAATTFSISGTISGTGGEMVTLSGAATATVTADASGNYSFTGLANGNYAVAPSKAGFTFSPASALVTINGANVSGVNFTATAVSGGFSISGTISGTGGETVTLSGAANATVAADASGNYSFTGLANGNYTVTPSKSGFTFTPANAAVTINGGNVIGVNFTANTALLSMDANISANQGAASTTVVTATFSTVSGNELLLAFISADAKTANITVSSVTGAGLTWTLVKRTNAQLGTSEIWRAFASSPLSGVKVTATLSQKVASSITVISFTGVDTSGSNGSGAIGATATASAASGAPSASLVTTRNGSWVFGVGNDWDSAKARTPGPGQGLVHQYLAPVGDTYWVQKQNSVTPLSGSTVTINDTAPTTDRFNLSICEILPAP